MIKILFLDTSALLSFFISDQGTSAMRWLISSENKAHHATRYVINNRVIREFEAELNNLTRENKLKQGTADNILDLFNSHYKNQKFKIVGKEASVKQTMDGMYHFLGRLARPMLVTCRPENIEKDHTGENFAYKIINPYNNPPAEIELILQGKNPALKKPAESKGLYQRIFRKTRQKKRLGFAL